MLTVNLDSEQRSALDRCLARPYPSGEAHGDAGEQVDRLGRRILVLTDVPDGVGAGYLFEHVADDARNGLIPGMRNIHDESPYGGGVRIVFTPDLDADPAGFLRDLRTSIDSARLGFDRRVAGIRTALGDQATAVTLSEHDWFLVHEVLTDARFRDQSDEAVSSLARAVDRELLDDGAGRWRRRRLWVVNVVRWFRRGPRPSRGPAGDVR